MQLCVRKANLRPSASSRACTLQIRASAADQAAAKYGWDFSSQDSAASSSNPRRGRRIRGGEVKELAIDSIRRPLQYTKENDQEKVAALMESISDIGLQEPIDVLEVDGRYYGFSGCHRFEAHQKLGKPTILCRVRKATQQSLEAHLK